MNMNATLLGQAIAFSLFVWFCMKYVWPPIMQAIEERQKKIIIYSTIAVLVIVIGLVVYGVIDRYVLKARTDVIELESQSITVSDFDQYVRWTRRNIIIEIDQILATFQQLGSSPEMFAYFEQQLIASTTQLQDPILVGQEVIRILSDEIIMRVEAEKMGIEVDDALAIAEEVDV